MNAEMDPKISKMLDKTSEDIGGKLDSRLAEKWPEYRETDDAERRKEIVVEHHRRMAMRWAKVWLPRDGDREVRAVETVFADYLERLPDAVADAGSADRVHNQTLQGLINLGNALSAVLKAAQAGNREARLAAIDHISDAVKAGTRPVDILEESSRVQPIPTVETMDPNDVMD